MTLRTVPVTCTAIDQSGNPVAGGRFRFELTGTDIDQGLVAPEPVEAQAGEDGILVIHLWPNELGVHGSNYRVRCWNNDTGKKYLDTTCVVPNSPCRLEQIIQSEPFPEVDASQQALMALQAAQADIHAKVVQASAAQVSAAQAADAAATSAQTASGHRLNAQLAQQDAITAKISAQAARDDALDAQSLASQAAFEASEDASRAEAVVASAAEQLTQTLDQGISAVRYDYVSLVDATLSV